MSYCSSVPEAEVVVVCVVFAVLLVGRAVTETEISIPITITSASITSWRIREDTRALEISLYERLFM
jgi:hypothetical protein